MTDGIVFARVILAIAAAIFACAAVTSVDTSGARPATQIVSGLTQSGY
jgi:hypothetical protein